MTVAEYKFPADIIAHMSEGIYSNVLQNIASELIDVRTSIDRKRAISFNHPVARNGPVFEGSETNQYDDQEKTHNLS